MASFGKVLDLLDERYLKLVQDVAGNVEPMPKLVPYDEWKHNVIVYRMDTDHDIFLNVIQHFTATMSPLLGKELWTWYVQWEVGNYGVSIPSPKKPRLQISHAKATPKPKTPPHKPIIDRIHRCVIDPDLMQEEEMLRALINIVQVESSTVPNVIEWLYQWIDHFEGDGTALKAALNWEIPSLWDFDYHPLLLPEELKRRLKEEKAEQSKAKDAMKPSGQGGKTTTPSNIRELAQGSPTKKIRAKPVLAAMEHRIEESERLKYREVKYGIKPPEAEQPLPPLINIPRDELKRIKYYNACYRSRHRALVLLLEAGITLQQISSYVKGQEQHPRDTPVPGNLKDLEGMKHYKKDAEAGQDYYKIREKLQLQAVKQNEIATSDRLAVDAQLVTSAIAPQGRTSVPLLPHAPLYAPQPDTAANILSKLEAAKAKAVDTVNFVPTPLVGGLKSNYLAHARDKQEMQGPNRFNSFRAHSTQPDWNDYGNAYDASVSEKEDDGVGDDDDVEEESGSDTDADTENDDSDSGGFPGPPPTQFTSTTTPSRPSIPSSTNMIDMQPPALSFTRPANTGFQPTQLSPAQAGVAEYIRSLTSQEAADFIPWVQQDTRNMLAAQRARNQAPLPGNVATRPSGHFPAIPPPSMYQMNPTRPSPQTPSVVNSGPSAGGPRPSQSLNNFMPLRPPTFARPPVRAVAPVSQQTTTPLQPSPALVAPSTPYGGWWTLNMFQINSPAQRRPPATSAALSYPPAGFHPDQGLQQRRSNNGAYSQSSQVSRPSHATIPHIPASPFSSPFNVLNSPREVDTNPPLPPQAGTFMNYATSTFTRQPLSQASSSLPPPTPGRNFNIEHLMALQRQQETQAQAPQQQRFLPTQNPNPYTGPVMQPPRLQFRNTQQDGSQHAPPISAWPAAPQSLQRPIAPSTMMTAPRFPPPQPLRQQSPDAHVSNLQNMLQTATRPPVPPPLPPPMAPATTPNFPPPPFMDYVPLPGIQRNAPTPLTLRPPTTTSSPFTTLANSLLVTTPFRSTARGTPIQLFFPKIVIPGNGIGPGGTKLGDNGHTETDAMLLGYTIPGSGKIVFERALFMPLGCWTNTQRRARLGHADVLESYGCAFNGITGEKMGEPVACHRNAYKALSQAFSFMVSSPPKLREELLTKRWRASEGPMTQRDRGAVWEGWGVTIDRPIEMGREERKGLMIMKRVIDDGTEARRTAEQEAKYREMEEYMEMSDEGDLESDEDITEYKF
jgi:hypothetical protein